MTVNLPFEATMIIDSVLERSPKLAEVFNAHGMACVGCVFSRFHSLADVATLYHLDVDRLIHELSLKYDSLTGRKTAEP